MRKEQWAIIGKGDAGWHANAKDCRSTSYSTNEKQLNEYASDAVDGAPVYDASEADYGAFAAFVISGPMVNADLVGVDADHFSDKDRKRALEMCGPGGLSGGFDTMVFLNEAQAQRPDKKFSGFGGLDYVSPQLYINLMRKHVPGVRFGKVVNGAVVWENEQMVINVEGVEL